MGGTRVAKERITWLLPHTLKSRHKPFHRAVMWMNWEMQQMQNGF